MIWKTFFRVFAERSPTPYFYNEISPSRGPSFHNFDSKMAKLHFWPKRGQWDPMWSEFDSIWIKFDPNWVKLGPKEAQSIFSNSRSTAIGRTLTRSLKRSRRDYAIDLCSIISDVSLIFFEKSCVCDSLNYFQMICECIWLAF